MKIEKLEPNFSSFTAMLAKNKKKKCIMVSNPWWNLLIASTYALTPVRTVPFPGAKKFFYLGTKETHFFALSCYNEKPSLGEQGWRNGESTRLPPMWPRFDSRTRRHMWVEFVVGSLLCSERFFSGYSGFPLSAKTNISKYQFDPECSSV